jgi:thiamine pyrophosphokinase
MRAIIVANGQVNPDERYGHLLRADDWVIAADGGAILADKLGLEPQLVIGDMDSLPPHARAELEARGCQFVAHSPRKDETDTELAIRYALQQGADEIVLLGAAGDRLDHTLANFFLRALPELAGVRATIVSGDSETWLLRGGGELEIRGSPGDTVTLLPVGQDAVGVSTQGLEWPLHGHTLRFGPARGVSNVMTVPVARVTLRQGLLLVFRLMLDKEEKTMTEEDRTQTGDATDLVDVYATQGHLRAHVIKSKLEASGIPAMLSYDYASLAFGLTVDGIGQVRVKVSAQHADEARRVIEEEEQ